MSSPRPTSVQGPSAETSGQAQHLGTVVWALFFIWAGVVILAAVPWGWFLSGVGLLVLAAQLARWQMGMEIEGFWIACGIVFLAGGLWNIFDLPWPLPAVMLIALGAVLLGKVFVAVRH